MTIAGSLARLVASDAMFATGGVAKGTLGVCLPMMGVPLLSLIMPAN